VRTWIRAHSHAMLTTPRLSSPNLPASSGRHNAAHTRGPAHRRIQASAVTRSSGSQRLLRRR